MSDRYILVLADGSKEMEVALQYACARAKKTGRKIIIASFIKPPDVLTTQGVTEIMRNEAREEAEEILKRASSIVKGSTGLTPVLHLSEGEVIVELIALIEREKNINVLVLAANVDEKGPGEIINTLLTNKVYSQLRIPVMIVPGNFSKAHIALITWIMNNNYQDETANILLNIESIKFSFNKPFILTSGQKSPVYVDCRKIISFIKERNKILDYAEQYFTKNNISFDIIAGGETAGIPYASFLAERLQKQMIYIRKKAKDFGKNQQIEGSFKEGHKAILIEDLATNGGSKAIFINAMRKSNLKVQDIFVIFYYDIFQISKGPLNSLNVKIHYLCTWKNIINILIVHFWT